MGLDAVELIMATEEAFGIQIADEEASLVRTPRDLYAVVARRLRLVNSSTCLTQRAFYLLRKTLRKEYDLPRSILRPATALEEIVPRTGRPEAWRQLRKAVGATVWPNLRYPPVPPVGLTLTAISVWVIALSSWAAIAVDSLFGLNWILLVAVTGFLLGLISYGISLCSESRRVSLAGDTVGTLSEYLVALNPHLLSPPSEEWTAERIRVLVRQIIVEQLAIDPDFDDEADFVKDLGLS